MNVDFLESVEEGTLTFSVLCAEDGVVDTHVRAQYYKWSRALRLSERRAVCGAGAVDRRFLDIDFETQSRDRVDEGNRDFLDFVRVADRGYVIRKRLHLHLWSDPSCAELGVAGSHHFVNSGTKQEHACCIPLTYAFIGFNKRDFALRPKYRNG